MANLSAELRVMAHPVRGLARTDILAQQALVAAASELDAHDGQVAELRALLVEARNTIMGLVDQQAMADDWYQAPLERIEAAIAGR